MADQSVSILPPVLNVEVYGGDDVTLPVTVTRGGEPLDLGADHLSQIRAASDSDTVLGVIGVTVVDGPAGQATLDISGTMTDGLLDTAGVTRTWKDGGVTYRQREFSGVYDWQSGTAANDDVLTICGGTFSVKGDVTREVAQ